MGVVMAWRVWLILCSFYSFWEPGIVPLLLDDHVAKNLLYFEVMDHIDNGELDTRWLWCRCVQWIEHARSWYDVSPCGYNGCGISCRRVGGGERGEGGAG